MPLNNARQIHLPYCIKRLDDGRFIVLNREYLPLGYHDKQKAGHVVYEDHPSAVRVSGLTPKVAAKISHEGSTDMSAIFLYDDGSLPERTAASASAYFKRLGVFMKLKKKRERR